MSHWKLGVPLLLLSSVLVGCQDPDGCLPGASPELTLGKGLDAYVPLEQGGRQLELVHGPQGGYHVDLALQARRLDSSDVAVAQLTGYLGGEQRAESLPYVDLRCNGPEDALQAWALRLIWDAEPEELDEQPVDIALLLTDVAGTSLDVLETNILIVDPLL